MSAEKNTSNGAPFSICVRKFPEDPELTRTVQPLILSKFAAISFMAKVRSDAAATVTVPQALCGVCDVAVATTAANATSNIAGMRLTYVPLEFRLARS